MLCRPALLSMACLSALGFCQSADWQVAVGGTPNRVGRSTWEGPTGPNLLWSGGLSAVVAQQGAAEGDRFFVARMFDINDVLHGTLILCYDLNTGAELWRKDLPVDNPSTDWRNKLSSVRNGVVYATRAGNTNLSPLYALDALTGNILWRSVDKVDETSTESLSFTSDGDVVAGNFANVKRIRATDGTTVWTANRASPSSDGSSVAVFGNHGYTWEAGSAGPKVDVIDLGTGQIVYRSTGIGGGFVEQLGLMVGPDGTVYAPRSQNNPATDFFVAFMDTGSALVEKWRYPMGYCPFASHAVAVDGSVYTYARTSPPTVVRLDSGTGGVLSTSPPLPSDFFQPRIAVDAAGRVYLTNGAFSNGTLFSLNPDLSPRWSVPVSNVNLGGPVLAKNGTLLVCGTSNIRAYRDPQDTLPTSFTIFRGILLGGNLQSLFKSDDDDLVVQNGLVLNPSEPPIAVTVDGTAPLSHPGTFQFKVEAHVSTSGLTQDILLYDWNQGVFALVDSRPATTADSTVTVSVPDPAPYVQPGTLAVRSRVQYRKTGPVATFSYTASLDQTVWSIRP